MTRDAALTSICTKEHTASGRPQPDRPRVRSQGRPSVSAQGGAPLDEGFNCVWDQHETAISFIPLRCARAARLGRYTVKSVISLLPRYKCEWNE